MRKMMLWCGVLATLTYAAADVAGSLADEAYSVTSQGISELMATGSPSERIVDPIFLVYGVLTLAFGIGVVRAAGANRPLKIAGAVLAAYAAIGFAGPIFFEVKPRGMGAFDEAVPHVILTAVLVALWLLTMGFGAFAFGPEFKRQSFRTILTIVLFGAISGAYGGRLAANQPTPWFGIIERVVVYSALIWTSALAVQVLRSRPVLEESPP